MSKIDRTFYNVSSQYIPLLNDIPQEIIQFTAWMVTAIQDRLPYETNSNLEEQSEEILEQTTRIIEAEMGLQVRRDTFNYAGFATHLRYLLQRVQEEKHIDSSNVRMYLSIQEEYPQVSACVDKIAGCYQSRWSIQLSEEEKFYLIMHVNRVCSKESV